MPREKTGERKKGIPNKVSGEIKDFFTDFLHENLDDMEECICVHKNIFRFQISTLY